MTTIVYRNGIMAADSRAYGGDKVPIGEKVKIRRLEDGTLLGATSAIVGASQLVMDWYAEGCPKKPEGYDIPDKFTLLVVKPDGAAYMANDGPNLTGPLTAPFQAVGSGEEFALGAMAHGASAVEAVVAACKLDVWSDLPVYAASHDGRMPKLKVGLTPDQFKWVK
jgi:ATP-dependent protease HslVU (ClpYQ) peptidase subunit